MLPLIITDFDGIVNPMGQLPFERQWSDMEDSYFIDSDGQRNPVVISPTVVNFYHEMVNQADTFWLTSWVHHTEVFPRFLGLPEIPYLADPWTPADGPTVWWKFLVIREISKGRRVLWMEDEIPLDPNSDEQKFLREHGNIKTIVPATSKGLSPAHLDEIRAFLAG